MSFNAIKEVETVLRCVLLFILFLVDFFFSFPVDFSDRPYVLFIIIIIILLALNPIEKVKLQDILLFTPYIYEYVLYRLR